MRTLTLPSLLAPILILAADCLGLPLITKQPTPATNSVSLGASLTNRITAATTSAPLSYQWRFNTVDLPGATNANLVLTNIQETNAGSYTVLVSDADGSVESKPWGVQVDASFTKITGESILAISGVGVAWGDYDNDGFPDLFIGTTANNPNGSNNPNQLYHNGPDHTFSIVATNAFPAGSGSLRAAWADYDNDGALDLICPKIGVADLLYHNHGDGTFSKITDIITNDGGAGLHCAWGDFNNDGFVDLFVANEGGNNALFQNNGQGGFAKVTNSIFQVNVASQASAWADYDNDGLPDLFVVNYQNHKNLLYHNVGNGQFALQTNGVLTSQSGEFSDCAWGDYDNDGYLDLVVCSYGPKNTLYHNNGDGTFTKNVNSPISTDPCHSYSAAWGDYDNDGNLDLFISNGTAGFQHGFLYHNNGNGAFARVTAGSPANDLGEGRTSAWIDYDRDGFLDLWVAHSFGNLNSLYKNNGNSNAWLVIQCQGRVSNRAAIGAKIRVKATIRGQTVWQLRQIAGNDLDARFGLGDATNVEVVRIEWQSGIVQELANVAPKQFLVVKEPPKLTAEFLPGKGELQLAIAGGRGLIYGLESTTDFTSWIPVASLTNQTGTVTWTNKPFAQDQVRLFRVREL